jgi:signal transduction histidine kinase
MAITTLKEKFRTAARKTRTHMMVVLVITGGVGAQGQPLEHTPSEYRTIPVPPRDTLAIRRQLDTAFQLMKTNRDSALAMYQEILQTSKTLGYPYGIITALILSGKIYADKGMYPKGLFLLNEAAWYCTQSEWGRNEAFKVYNNIGIIYNYQGNYDEAARYYYKAAQLAEKYNSSEVAMIYNNLSGVLFRLGLQDQPLHYLEKSRQLAIRTGNRTVLTKILLNLGTIYMERKDWEKTYHYLKSALDTARIYRLPNSEHEALTALGEMYLMRDQPRQTLAQLEAAERLNLHLSSLRKIAVELLAGVARFELKEYRAAERHLLWALQAAETDHMPEQKIQAHNFLAQLYGATGKPQLAYKHLLDCMALKDSVQKRENARHISLLDARYRSAQKDKEIAENRLLITQQERNIERKNIWIAGIIITVIVTTAVLIAVYRSYRNKQRMQAKQIEILEQQQEILNQKQEIHRLRAMMQGEEKERTRIARELHDGIGGMLSAVKMNLNAVKNQHPELSAIKGLDNVMQMLQDTTAEVRKTAHNLMPDILVRHKLSEALRIYCDHINMGNELYVVLQLHGEIDAFDKSIDLLVYRTVQELLQNIVKHAQASHAVVQIIRNGDELHLIVEDNGIGFDVRKQAEGYGLQNLQFRIQALQGSISIESAREVGTTIFIKLDVQKLDQTFVA